MHRNSPNGSKYSVRARAEDSLYILFPQENMPNKKVATGVYKYPHPFQSRLWTFRIECPMDSSLPRTWGDQVIDCVWLHQNVDEVEHLIGFVRFRSNKSKGALEKLCPSAYWFYCSDPLQAVDDILLDEQPFRGPFVIGSKYRLFPFDEENKENVPTTPPNTPPCPYTKKP